MSVEQLANTLDAMDTDALSIGRAIHQPIEDSRQIMSSFDEITYQKGAGVLGMIESYLGEERFRRGVRLHLQRHLHGTATAEDFFSAMSEAAGDAGVIEAFRSFIDQPGVPTVAVALSSDGTSLSLKQSRYRPLGSTIRDGQLWKIPVCVRLTNGPKTTCALLTGATGQLPLGAAAGSVSIFPNAGGRGYYRFVVDSASQRALIETAAGLPGREALALADSVAAGFAAGELTFDDLLATAAALATHADRSAATKLGYYLTDLHDSLADQTAREGLARTIANIYGPRLRAIGYDPAPRVYAKEGADRELLRRSLASIVALHGRDRDVRRTFAEAAHRSLQNPEAVDAGMRARVWAVGVQELPAEFADGLVKHLFESADAAVRLDAAYALGHAEQADVAGRARSLLLDARLAGDNAFAMLSTQMQNPATRNATWTWFTQHGEEVVAKLPAIYQPLLVRMGDRLCDPERRDAFEKFLGPRLAKVGVDALPLARETERINLCIALMNRHQASIKSAVTDSGAAARRP
jgi:aminopeptidase N